MKQSDYDIIVVGGGHAGVEASLASARLGMNTLLVTQSISSISRMSCNPSIGGLAKGHLVAEIDALGGEMARIIDQTGIQFKMLNKSKGRAVWSPRAQADKLRYSLLAQKTLLNQNNLDIVEDSANAIIVEEQTIRGVNLKDGGAVLGRSVVLTCGTFLNGLIHIGLQQYQGGRIGEARISGLTESLAEHGISSGRLKTGTPPRISGQSIDFSKTTPQYGDADPVPFSLDTKNFNPPNTPCFLTHTNKQTHDIILNNLDRSPLYSGIIKGVGPRYCPSIEDKCVRFKERISHQIFLEPEWINSNEYYVNGFATSLPTDIQERALRSVPALENAEIIKYGYAIEYDFFPAYQIYNSMETKIIGGLYLAGQINGTSGYEEAAALGLMAGINAALKLQGKESFVLQRHEAYIGVLIDDLITKSPSEPYRMFTSSAEHRLLLRFDNADRRLSDYGENIGLLPETRAAMARMKAAFIQETIDFLTNHFISADEANRVLEGFSENPIRGSVSLYKLLSRPAVTLESITSLLPAETTSRLSLYPNIMGEIECDIKYDGYIKHSLALINSMKQNEKVKIPPGFDFSKIHALTSEAREKLMRIKPQTLGQASRISGVSPADIAALFFLLYKQSGST